MLSQLYRRQRHGPAVDADLKKFKAEGQIKSARTKLQDVVVNVLVHAAVEVRTRCL